MEEKNVSLEEATTESTVKEEETVEVANESTTTKLVDDANTPKEEKGKFKRGYEKLILSLNGMAYGLFATLIIGTILATIGTLFGKGAENSAFCGFFANLLSGQSGVATCLQYLTGAGIGAGVAIALKKKPLEIVVLSAVGEIAAFLSLSTKFVTTGAIADPKFQIGDPLTIFLTVIVTVIAMKYTLRKKTPVDILLVPLFGMVVGVTAGWLLRFPAIYVTFGVQWIVNAGTNTVPFLMGIIVAVLMGMALTAPISSAAIGAMVFVVQGNPDFASLLSNPETSGLALASGAAVVGCSCQMIGFAIQSRKDNSIGMVISIAIGTSMLQFKNILRRPQIWAPSIIASAILGPISTCWLHLVCMGSSAGMGTSGLVGQIGTIGSMGAEQWQTWVGIFGLQIIAPALIVYGLDILFRRLHWYKDGDLLV